MADEIPLFPSKTNLSTFKDFVNLQKEMNDHLMAERHLYEQIGKINLDIQTRVVKRRQQEFDTMKDIQSGMVKIQDLESKLANTRGVHRKELNRQLKSAFKEIENKQKYIEMSKMASTMEMEMAKKIHDENNRWFVFAEQKAASLFGLKVSELDTTRSIGAELMKTGKMTEGIAFSLGTVLMMLQNVFTRFVQFDKAAWEFRKAMGASRVEVQAIRSTAEKMAIDFMHIGVTIDGAYKSFQALGKVMGGVHNISQGIAENVAIMAAQLGVSEEISAGFLRNLAAVSRSSMEAQQSMMYFAQSMSAAGGVPLGEVMKDVSSKSGTTLTMMSRLPNVALKSAIELRRMGTSLDQSAKASRHLLDFTENVQEEMEASVLLGRSINLQRARELAYSRNLEGSTKEILRIAKSVRFEQLDPFQQDAFARATGRSVDELMNMLQTDRQIERVRRNGTAEQQKQLKLYENLHSANQAIAKAQAKNVEALFRSRANQERIVAIQNKWNQLLAKANQFLLPIIDKLLKGVLYLMDWTPQIMMLLTPLSKVFGWLSKITNISEKVVEYFRTGSEIGIHWFSPIQKVYYWLGKVKIIGAPIVRIFEMLSKGFGLIGRSLGFFGKFLGPIGLIITGFQFIGNLFSRFSNTEFVKGDWLGNIWKGLVAIGGAMYDTLLKPFEDAWNWIKSIFVGKSPSKLALGIVQGIASIGSMMFRVLTAPYRMAFQFVIKSGAIVGKMLWKGITSYFGMWKTLGNAVFEGAKYLGSMLWKGLKSMAGGLWNFITKPFKAITSLFKHPVETRAQAAYIPAVTVTPQGTTVEGTGKSANHEKNDEKDVSMGMTEDTGQKIVALLEKILAKDTNVHMDGSLLSTALARSVEFRGQYGVNK